MTKLSIRVGSDNPNPRTEDSSWKMPGRLHVFGTKEDMRTWHEVFCTVSEMEEWLKNHPTYKVYSRWVSTV